MVEGLGNQLFVLAAAWEQADRLGCPLYVDNSWYQHRYNSRVPELDAIGHPGVDVTERSPWAGANLLWGPPGLIPVRSGGQLLQIFTSRDFGYDPLINTCVPGTTVTGFCQSPMYFEAIAGTLADRLLGAELRPSEREYVDVLVRDRRTTVHVRRGDYLNAYIQSILGVTEIGYFRRAAALYERLHGESRYRVYSDASKSLEALLGDFPNAEISNPPAPLRSIAVLRAMASADGFIMSNSTFGWWAAWLMTKQDPEATVIAPRPWLSSDESASDLLLPGWITLDRRG
jgi:hypothetical protein